MRGYVEEECRIKQMELKELPSKRKIRRAWRSEKQEKKIQEE